MMKKIIPTIFLLIGCLTVNAQTFVHPGGLSNASDLAYIQTKIQAQAQPWYGKYTDMVTNLVTPAWNNASAPQDNGGGTENAMKEDARQCYASALAWYYSGNAAYGAKAAKILNIWATTFNGYSTTQGQSQLDCSWIGSLFAPAAELLRGYTGFGAPQQALVATMFKTKFVPALNKQPVWNNGNIDLTMAEALFGIAVFCDDITLFNAAIAKLNTRTPLFFYTQATGTPSNVGDWFSPTKWTDGLMQESCRTGGNHTPAGNDNGHHTQFALAAALHAAEVAWNQGTDLYATHQARYVAAIELLALQLSSGSMQGTCSDNVATTDLWDTFEVGYNHYHNRKGIDLPNTLKLLTTRVRTANNGDWNIFYETLTHDLDGKGPDCVGAAPVPTKTSYTYSMNEVATQLSAAGTNLLWYTTANGVGSSTAPTPSTTVEGSKTYYVSQTLQGVESCRASITVTVENIFVIPKVGTAPLIDGTIETLWDDNTYTQSFTKVIQPTVTSTADLSGTFKAYWDNTYLYVLGDVSDDSKFNDSPESYFDDGIELYFDINNDKAATYGANDVAYNFGWNNGVIVGTTPATGRSTTGITYAIADKTGGYIFEARIPWTTLQGTPAVNQLVGFDFHVNDDDNGAGRDGKLSWAAATDDAWQNPAIFGTAKLGDIILSTSAQHIAEMNKIQVYPNPSNGFFNITTVEAVSVKVFDNVGRYVDEFNMNGSHNFGSNYATGLYHVQLINSDGVVKTLKIVKEF